MNFFVIVTMAKPYSGTFLYGPFGSYDLAEAFAKKKDDPIKVESALVREAINPNDPQMKGH